MEGNEKLHTPDPAHGDQQPTPQQLQQLQPLQQPKSQQQDAKQPALKHGRTLIKSYNKFRIS